MLYMFSKGILLKAHTAIDERRMVKGRKRPTLIDEKMRLVYASVAQW